MLPLYGLIFLGWWGGKLLKFQKHSRETVAQILIYLIAPVMVFTSLVKIDFEAKYLLLPVLFFTFCSSMAWLSLKVSRKVWPQDLPLAHLAAVSAGDGNSGYFGIPVAAAVLGESAVPFVILCAVGFIIYENSLGFYYIFRGRFTAKQAIQKTLRLPTLYALIAGILVSFLRQHYQGTLYSGSFSTGFLELSNNFKSAYSVLGMMMIGFGASELSKAVQNNAKQHRFHKLRNWIDFRYLLFNLIAKFLFWPLIVGSYIVLDMKFLHIFNIDIYKIFLLLSCVPLAANTVAMATLIDVQPQKVSLTVIISTFICWVMIPFVVSFF